MCTLAQLLAIPSQDELGWLQQEGRLVKNGKDDKARGIGNPNELT